MCSTFKVINLTYLHVLRVSMVYVTHWYVHVPRYVLGKNCIGKTLPVELNFCK